MDTSSKLVCLQARSRLAKMGLINDDNSLDVVRLETMYNTWLNMGRKDVATDIGYAIEYAKTQA